MKNRNRTLGAWLGIAAIAIGGCGGHRMSAASPAAAAPVSPAARCQANVMKLLAGFIDLVKQGYDPATASGDMYQSVINRYGELSPTFQTFAQVSGELASQISLYGVSGTLGPATQREVYNVCQQFGAGTGTVGAEGRPATAPAPAAMAQPTSPAAEQPGFASALSVWKQTQHVWPAHCRSFLIRAADDLRAAGDSRYTAEIGRLTSLASIPLRGVTPAQSNQGYADVQALNRFFGTPGLITC